jgi:GntR family transcriptional regulator, transcriptional repressor for pyruvate dehydrogenase complex
MKPTIRNGNNNLSERVTQYLVKHIHDNDLKPGDRVPSEVQISGKLGISRGVVRQAYHSLRTAGILEIAMGRSPRVGELSHAAFTPLLDHALSTEQVSVEDVLELRFAVEIHAAELAATHRTEAQVEALKKAVAGMRKTLNDHDRFARIDVRFHQLIGKATGNALFEIFSRTLHGSLESSIRMGLRSRSTLAQIEKIVDTHQAIVDAIEAQQPSRARNLMALHFDEAKNALQVASKGARHKLR